MLIFEEKHKLWRGWLTHPLPASSKKKPLLISRIQVFTNIRNVAKTVGQPSSKQHLKASSKKKLPADFQLDLIRILKKIPLQISFLCRLTNRFFIESMVFQVFTKIWSAARGRNGIQIINIVTFMINEKIKIKIKIWMRR